MMMTYLCTENEGNLNFKMDVDKLPLNTQSHP